MDQFTRDLAALNTLFQVIEGMALVCVFLTLLHIYSDLRTLRHQNYALSVDERSEINRECRPTTDNWLIQNIKFTKSYCE